jgi:hypothetical protein
MGAIVSALLWGLGLAIAYTVLSVILERNKQ